MTETQPAEAVQPDEEILAIPSSLLKATAGFSLDFGGSCIKLVYASGERKGDDVIIRMKSFASSQLQTTVKLVKEILGNKIKTGQTIFTTGVGCHREKEFIESELGINLVNLSEMNCFVEAFRFLLSNYTIDKITYGESSVAQDYKNRMMGQIIEMLEKDSSTDARQGDLESAASMPTQKKDDAEEKKEDKRPDSSELGKTEQISTAAGKDAASAVDQYPCLLVMLGSGAGIIKVEKEGYIVIDGVTRCGRMFLGLGSLLINCSSFDELIDLASRGNEEKLTVLAKHIKHTDKADVYSLMPDDLVLYSFGHAVGHRLDEFRREDLAACLLMTISQDLAQSCQLNALALHTKTVFFCGSFAGQSQLVRNTIGRFFTLRSTLSAVFNMQHIDHHFLKYGGYLGAIGCLIRNLNNYEVEQL